MPARIANIILLVEDLRQETFLRRYLQRLGHGNRTMRVVKPSVGRGSGEQFVRGKYASEVRSPRAQLHLTKACLIAMIDVDAGSVKDHRQQFESALEVAGHAPRTAKEPILNLTPKWSIETWILCLNFEHVSEAASYRQDPRISPDSIKLAATQLYAWTRPNASLSDDCTDSLRSSHAEFRRIPGDD